MKRLLITVVSLFTFVGCAHAEYKRPSSFLSCTQPEGYEYVCYNEKQCLDYLKAYGGMVRYKFEEQKNGWWKDYKVMKVYINLFLDHINTYMIGLIEGEKRDGKIWQKMWLMTCDLEYNIMQESYSEGWLGYQPKEVQKWTSD